MVKITNIKLTKVKDGYKVSFMQNGYFLASHHKTKKQALKDMIDVQRKSKQFK